MGEIAYLQEELMEVHEALAQTAKSISEDPQSFSLTLTYASLEKRRKSLEERFAKASRDAGEDICRYRFFSENRPTLLSFISRAMLDFQELVSEIHSALSQSGEPNDSSENAARSEAEFELAYTFPGSLGVALRVSKAQGELFGGQLDAAFRVFTQMAEAKDQETLKPLVASVGLDTVRKFYEWTKEHAASGFGADINWMGKSSEPDRVFLQPIEFERLRRLVGAYASDTIELVELKGTLDEVSMPEKTFGIKSGRDRIRGIFTDAITAGHTATLPSKYLFSLNKKTMQPICGDPTVTWDLLALKAIPKPQKKSRKPKPDRANLK